MGVITTTEEYTSTIAPARLFKALVLESHIIVPKLAPEAIKSIEFIEGDGGAGSIKQSLFPEGSPLKLLKYKIDELDVDKYYCKYTLIEGEYVLGDILEKVVYEVNFEPSGAGCVCKTTSNYHTKGGLEINEEKIKADKYLQATGMYKVVDDYLVANPGVCA